MISENSEDLVSSFFRLREKYMPLNGEKNRGVMTAKSSLETGEGSNRRTYSVRFFVTCREKYKPLDGKDYNDFRRLISWWRQLILWFL